MWILGLKGLIAACAFLLFKGPQTKSRHSRGEVQVGGGGGRGGVTGMRVFSLWGVKLQILVSLRVFGMESHYICPIQGSLRTLRKENYKKCRH